MNAKKKVTWDDVMTMFAENERRWAETDRRWAESKKEAEIRQAKLDNGWAKTERTVDKLCGKIGGIEKNNGHHAEQFFQDSLAHTLTFGGEKYDYMVPNLKYIGKKENGEFDIVLINGKSIALIEVKNRIHPDFVKELAENKIERFRKYFKSFGGHKAYLGVAGFSFCEEVMDEAQKYGVGVIKQSGKSIEIEADHLKAY